MQNTKNMTALLQIMNSIIDVHPDLLPDFAFIPDIDGDDTDKTYGFIDDIFVDQLLKSGQHFVTENQTIQLCDMPLGRCHKNALEALEENEIIYTGFAQIDCPSGCGDWFPHSWIVNSDNQIVETFSQSFPRYFGFALAENDLTLFKDLFDN